MAWPILEEARVRAPHKRHTIVLRASIGPRRPVSVNVRSRFDSDSLCIPPLEQVKAADTSSLICITFHEHLSTGSSGICSSAVPSVVMPDGGKGVDFPLTAVSSLQRAANLVNYGSHRAHEL